MPLHNRFDSRGVLSAANSPALSTSERVRISYLAIRAFILSSTACGRMRPTDRRFSMTSRLRNRFANFCASLLLALLILSVASAARADSDDGIVRVRSAVPMAEAITRIKADIADKG